jgi:20S proteasome subunit alpha 1
MVHESMNPCSCSSSIGFEEVREICAPACFKFAPCPNSNNEDKTFPLTEFIGCIYNGLGWDIQLKIQETINEFINYFEKYHYNIPMDYLIKLIADRNQFFTQYAYMRPLAVKMLIMGIDKELGPQLYKCEPSGFFSSQQICIMGEKENLITSYLIKQIKEKLGKLSCYIKTAAHIISVFKNFLETDIKSEDIEIIISTKNKSIFKLINSLETEIVINSVY